MGLLLGFSVRDTTVLPTVFTHQFVGLNWDYKTQIIGIFWFWVFTTQNYSTVSFVRCKGVVGFADVTFNFSITYHSPALTGNHYSEYQLFLYQNISEHREKGMTFDAIAEWLNKEGYLTVRGKKFRGAHVHSILKKRLAREELLNREYPPVWSDFSMEVVDKTILMSDFGFPDKRN